MSMLAPTLQAFFTDRLARQRQASPRTVAAYRDTFPLLLAFVQRQIGKAPFALGFEHLEATVIVAFLNHIEPTGTIARGPVTLGWRPFARSFGTRPCATPSMQRSFNRSWQFLRSASTEPSCRS